MAELDSSKAEMKSLRMDLKTGKSAAGLEDLFSALNSSIKNEKEATDSLSDAVSLAEASGKALEEAKKAKSDEEARKPELKKLERNISDLHKHQ